MDTEESKSVNRIRATIGSHLDILTGFDLFWDTWPKERRCAKGRARRAWAGAIKKTSAEVIIDALRSQIANPGGAFDTEVRYIPHPASWLNGERWDDGIVCQRSAFRNGALEALARSSEGNPALEHDSDA